MEKHDVWRALIIGTVVCVCLLPFVSLVVYRSVHPTVPPPVDAKDCVPKHDETGLERFTREGGRTTRYVKVWREGNALTVQDVAQGRDLRRYERLALADPVPRNVTNTGGEPIFAKARSFVWQHWRDRKLGYLTLTLSSVDATSTSHVFVEKGDNGQWRVYWRIVRHHSRVDDLPTDYDVRRASTGHDQNGPGGPLAPNVQHVTQRGRLEFLDGCGAWHGSW